MLQIALKRRKEMKFVEEGDYLSFDDFYWLITTNQAMDRAVKAMNSEMNRQTKRVTN